VRPDRFYIGLHHPCLAQHFERCFISVNTLRPRKGPFRVLDWIMDSGAFSEVFNHGGYRRGVEEYAAQIARWSGVGSLLAAVSQDYMCEPIVLAKTGLTVAHHQALTIERYDALLQELLALGCRTYVMPVLQGYELEEYVAHVRAYGARLAPGAWVGVGSVCKRNGRPEAIAAILAALLDVRPDLRFHGFGVKLTALAESGVRDRLYSSDSIAWSYEARKKGRDANGPTEALRYAGKVRALWG